MGMNQKDALNVVSKNCLMAFKHAHMRKTYKGVAELVFKSKPALNQEEEEKMTD